MRRGTSTPREGSIADPAFRAVRLFISIGSMFAPSGCAGSVISVVGTEVAHAEVRFRHKSSRPWRKLASACGTGATVDEHSAGTASQWIHELLISSNREDIDRLGSVVRDKYAARVERIKL